MIIELGKVTEETKQAQFPLTPDNIVGDHGLPM
jgi:hypothetical protein